MSLDLHPAPAHNPPPALAGRDVQTAEVVRKTEFISACVTLALAGFCVLIVLVNFVRPLFSHGLGEALPSGLISLAVMVLVFLVANRLLGALVLRPWQALRYRACTKRMVAELPTLGVQPAMLHQWSAPNPGVLALDTPHQMLYVNARSGHYQRLQLRPQDIMGVKVERESEVHTTTTHGGSLAVFSRMGIGYNFGSRSKSTSTVVERAFLEIHYQLLGAPAPAWLAVPFGEDRRAADSFAVAIQRL